jgi:hypothetical protein
VVTTENLNRPWLVFEAGALSKRLNGDPTKVVPLLVGFDDVNQIAASPLFQFQGVKLDEDGARRLCLSIARTIGLPEEAILTRFDRGWKDLEADVQAAIEAAGNQPAPPKPDETTLLTGMYQSIQSLQKQVAALSNSPAPPPRIVVSNSVVDSLVPRSPWTDGGLMQETQDGIKEIAATFKPVRWVNPMERNGEKVVGVMFEDGQGLSGEDWADLMRQVGKFPVVVRVESDRGN